MLLKQDKKLNGYLDCNIADFIFFDKHEMSKFSHTQINIDVVKRDLDLFIQAVLKYQNDKKEERE